MPFSLEPSFKRAGTHLFLLCLAGTALLMPSAASAQTGTGAAAGGAAVCSVKLLGTVLAGATTGVIGSLPTVVPTGMPVYEAGLRAQTGYSIGMQTTQTAIKTNEVSTDFASCLVRAAARALLQQMTVSVVNWINSGFEGQPSFVQNYEQFFTQVADNAVGNFLQGSDLAFLCSPFKLQIKIAVAQSYARRSSTQSCSLTKVTNNIQKFMNNFSEGGWPALLSFTTTPSNNPYGAYMDAQVRLGNTIGLAQGQKGLDLQLGRGFLSFQEKYDCKPAGTATDGTPLPPVCKTRTSTPGSTIANQLDTTLGTNFRQLELAQSFDQILSALINQLVVKTLYGGLSNLSGQQNFNTAPGDLAGSAIEFTQNLDKIKEGASQYRVIAALNESDTGAMRGKVEELLQCWEAHVASTTLSSTQRGQARANASSTILVYNNVESDRSRFASTTVRVGAEITVIEQFQERALSALNLSQLQNIKQEYGAVSAANGFVGPNDVPPYQRNRDALTLSLTSLASTTAAKLNQCHAFPPPTT